MVKQVFSSAPVRICDIGGWTDTWFFPNGAVFNFCIDLYSYVRIVENDCNEINIFSENHNLKTTITDIKNIKYDGTLDLLKAAVKRMDIDEGLDIFVRADAPPGSGTGTSASVAVSLLAALASYTHKKMKPYEIAKLAHNLETEELKLESGVQDQYAAAYGGINFMTIDYPSVNLSSVKINESRIYELENQLILVYLGSRSSDVMHKAVIENYLQGDKNTVDSFETLKNCAYDMKTAIYSNMEEIGNIMNLNWDAQKKLHPSMVNPDIIKVEKLAKNNGAIGFKCNGAGGGGSAVIMAKINHEYRLKRKLVKNGFQLIPFKLCFKGVSSFIK